VSTPPRFPHCSRLADLAAELDGLRLACTALSDAACLPGECRLASHECTASPAAANYVAQAHRFPAPISPPAPAACRAGGRLALSFINLDAEIKFGVTLQLPGSYPAGAVEAQPRVWFDGEGQITTQRIAQAVAAAPEAPGRLRAICRELRWVPAFGLC
jgi:hypothetical protein